MVGQEISENMKYNFCTLFNKNYLSKGLALYYSLEEVCIDFHLFIFAFDEDTFNVLNTLNLKRTTIISLREFEDEDLLSVKDSRSIAEYCWTATPSTIYYIIKKYNVESCTYIDADLYFYSSPRPIFDEFGEKSILITEHRYSPEYKKEEKKSGKYCVQFITFKNDAYGLEALTWWKNQCILWCYNRIEDGKFGDQMYLNDWTTRFQNVHILDNLGGGLAGWNISQYDFYKNEKEFYGIEKKSGKKFDIVFYHFHNLRFYTNGKLELGPRYISKEAIDFFYKPYMHKLSKMQKIISEINPSIDPLGITIRKYEWKTPLLFIKHKIEGRYHIYKTEDFWKL